MARKKSPSEWSPAYRKRIESYLRRNPDATIQEARGYKRKGKPYYANRLEQSLEHFGILKDTAEVKYELKLINKRELNKHIRAFERMADLFNRQYNEKYASKAWFKRRQAIEKQFKKIQSFGYFGRKEARDGVIFYH